MARYILLDSGPLGLACTTVGIPAVDHCHAWLTALRSTTATVLIPIVAEYEVRRELIRIGATAKLRNLDNLVARYGRLDVSIAAWIKAAESWAATRRAGIPTAHPHALDADCLLAGLAATIGHPGDSVTITTTNLHHLARFPGIDARRWETIT